MCEYLKPATSSPQERAMVAAENAKRVPSTEEGRFKMMGFAKEAMDALDECHESDQITRDLVREKLGEAQKRFGYL